MSADLSSLFDPSQVPDRGALRMFDILKDPAVSQITANSSQRIFYVDQTGPKAVDRVFAGEEQYIRWVNQLMHLTDVGYTDVTTARTDVIEGSFRPDRTDVHGSIHVCTKEITRGEPVVTIRKQPRGIVTLDQMLEQQQMMSHPMRHFLELAVRGRANILISGGSGAGKTTMARALSWFIDPAQRVLTCEEIDELHLADRLPNVVALTTFRLRNEVGAIQRETTLNALVREGLRMRPDRIWVGETRGGEAYALVKACNSGHDGSITTMHADDAQQAYKQLISYVMEANVTEEVARDQVARAFHLVIQISRIRMGRRVITEITELEAVREGTEQRRNPLFQYNTATDQFEQVGTPTRRLLETFERNGVNYSPQAYGRI